LASGSFWRSRRRSKRVGLADEGDVEEDVFLAASPALAKLILELEASLRRRTPSASGKAYVS
jgi:hypothetical protein